MIAAGFQPEKAGKDCNGAVQGENDCKVRGIKARASMYPFSVRPRKGVGSFPTDLTRSHQAFAFGTLQSDWRALPSPVHQSSLVGNTFKIMFQKATTKGHVTGVA